MKKLSDIAKNYLKTEQEGKIVAFIAERNGWRRLSQPTFSLDMKCSICDGSEHYTPFVDPSLGVERVWICKICNCKPYNPENSNRATITQPARFYGIQWPLFCEINNIGDVNHGVKFEDIKQSDGKISYLLKFAQNPSGIILMQGDPGTGKSFAALATCELFTRKNTSAIFTTQRQMFNDWMETFKNNTNYIQKISEKDLLVVDDFGTAEISAGFMSFFMDLINTRLQWKGRGTIITTNLNNQKFSNYCGEALSDRINTGQLFEFKGKTRRKQLAL